MTRAKQYGRGALYWRLMPDHSIEACSGDAWSAEGARRFAAIDAGRPDPWRVAFDELGGACYVSTVFVGLNTSLARMREGGPFVFETMARIGPRGADEVRRETASWADALGAHAGLVEEHERLMKESANEN